MLIRALHVTQWLILFIRMHFYFDEMMRHQMIASYYYNDVDEEKKEMFSVWVVCVHMHTFIARYAYLPRLPILSTMTCLYPNLHFTSYRHDNKHTKTQNIQTRETFNRHIHNNMRMKQTPLHWHEHYTSSSHLCNRRTHSRNTQIIKTNFSKCECTHEYSNTQPGVNVCRFFKCKNTKYVKCKHANFCYIELNYGTLHVTNISKERSTLYIYIRI